jgi:pre-mRNA-splicing factor ATP-dependent RNA helicase DHX38/PRP16
VRGAAGGGGRVQFDVAPSPALTPSWRSSSWSKAAQPGSGAKGEVRERSPELRPLGEGGAAGGGVAAGKEGGEEFDEQVRGRWGVLACVCTGASWLMFGK